MSTHKMLLSDNITLAVQVSGQKWEAVSILSDEKGTLRLKKRVRAAKKEYKSEEPDDGEATPKERSDNFLSRAVSSIFSRQKRQYEEKEDITADQRFLQNQAPEQGI